MASSVHETSSVAAGRCMTAAIVAFVIACAGVPLLDCGGAFPGRTATEAAVVAEAPAGGTGSEPLSMPAIAEAEISFDDVDPRETSVNSPKQHHRHAANLRRGGHSGRRFTPPAILFANAADLSRLCRLLL